MRKLSWIFLLIFAAAAGSFLLGLPGKVLTTYRELENVQPTLALAYLWLAVGLGATFALGTFYIIAKLWINTRRSQRHHDLGSNPITAKEKTKAIQDNLGKAKEVAEKGTAEDQQVITKETVILSEKQSSETLEIAAFGTISSGKSALLNALAGREVFHSDVKGGTTTVNDEVSWPSGEKIILRDTPGIGEISGEQHEQIARDAARSADIVLLVIDGALKSFEHDVLKKLVALGKRIFLCLNKADWITERDRAVLLEQLRDQVKGLIANDDIVVVQSKKVTRTRTRLMADGKEQQESVIVPPDISALAERILAVTERDGKDLLLANLLLRSNMLVSEARDRVRAHMDKRALAVVESHMWQAGGVAALAPPALDLFVTSGVIVKMAYELSKVYGEPMTMDGATKLLRELGKNLLSVLGTSAVLPSVSTMVGSVIKTIPGIGTIVGGALQGLTQALITRWIGFVLMDHFRTSTKESPGSIQELAKKKWAELTTPAALASFAKSWQNHFTKGNQ